MNRLSLDLGSSAEAIATTLEGLSDHDRAASVLSLAPLDQKELWRIASDGAARDGALVHATSDGGTQRYAGRNSLAMFSRFEKHFFRAGTRMFGYNSHALRAVTGPGYFGVAPREGGGYRFDYRELPDDVPPGSPRVQSNERPLARPVYGDLVDEVVWVSEDVLVGAAYRAGKPLDSYFVLVRMSEVSKA